MLIGHSFSDADGVIVSLDLRLCEFLRRSRASLVGASYLDITHPDDRPANHSALTSLRVGDILQMRKRYVLPDGTAVLADMHISRFETWGGLTRLIGSISTPERIEDLRSPTRTWSAARKALHMLSLRKEMLGELHSDFPWEIILHVYLAEAEGRAIAREEIGQLIDQSTRTSDRWIDLLHQRDIIDYDRNQGNLLQMSAAGLGKTEAILLS